MNNPFNNQNDIAMQFKQFVNNISSRGLNPGLFGYQQVQNLLNSGKMSQQDFNRYGQLANDIMGRKRNG